jgi:flotillin
MNPLTVLLDIGGLIGFLILIIVFLVFLMFVLIIRRYKRCPSDKILVIYGKVGKEKEVSRAAKVIHGGAAFVWPIFQDYEYMDLTPIPIVVDLKGALSNQNIRVNVPARFMVGISTEPGVMQNAAERLLGLNLQAVHDLAADIIFGQLRVVIATMKIEEINSDREKFLANVTDAVEHELKKIGLKLINVNVTDIVDDAGYIDALGKEATAHAINEAKKLVAEKERDGAIGEAEAKREQRIKVAEANAEAEIGEADATQKKRVFVAQANATAVEGENKSQIKIADSEAEKRIEVSEAMKKAEIAEKTNQAAARQAAYLAEKEAEIARAERDKASQYADVVVPQQIEKQKIEIAAEAEAERIRRIAKGNADGKFLEMEAFAKGTYEVLSKQAEGFKQTVAAAGNDPDGAVRLMIADKLEKLVEKQVEAIKNLKIDKITVWDSGKNADGNTTTADFIKGLVGSVPPMEELFNMAGMKLPEYLGKKKDENQINPDEISDSEG